MRNMAKKRKVRADRIIILFLSGALLIGLLGFGIYKAMDYFMNRPKTNGGEIVNPQPIETSSDVKVELAGPESYQVYTSSNDEIDFNFIVAELKFTGSEAISFDLGNLRTSEKIYLNDVSKYLNILNEKGYKVNKLGIVNTVVSQEKEYTCKVFIPYKTNSYTLRVLNSQDASMIEFNLDKHINDISSIKFDTQQQIEVGNTNVTVSSCYVSEMMLHNGETYNASALTVFTFKINVNKVEGNVMIEDAQFVRSNTDEVIPCLDETYQSLRDVNCLGKKLILGDNGALFFETSAKEENPDFSGYLMLKFSNSQDWVKIPTVLE